jgi:hypothetical protein
LDLFGIGSWLPVLKQKAWAQLILNKPDPLSHDHALFPFLGIGDLASPDEQSKWIEGERAKFEAAKLTKDERQTLREFALEPSQTEDDMLRLLSDRESFRGVCDSSMSHRARFKLVKEHELELVTVLLLKCDRDFLLKRLKERAGKLSAPPVADASAAVSATVSGAGAVLKTLAAPSSASAMFASALLEHPAAASTFMPLATGGATLSPAAALDDDAADLERLVELLARAKVVPATKRSQFARKLLDLGVCDEQAILFSINADPPDFDLVEDIGMTAPQKRSLETYLKNFKL